jgi:hypothetical protein
MATPFLYAWMIAFSVNVLFAVFANVTVYVILIRRDVPVRLGWAGVPGYLYRACLRAEPPVDAWVTRLARASIVAFALTFVLGLPLMFQRADV